MKQLNTSNLRNEKNGSGIYKIYNNRKKLIYVGRAGNGNIKHHIVQHFGSKHYSGAKFGARNHYYKIDLLPKTKIKKREKFIVKKLKPKANKYLYKKGGSRRGK